MIVASCPFCGGKNTKVVTPNASGFAQSFKDTKVECIDCSACGPRAENDLEAANKWNEHLLHTRRGWPPVSHEKVQ